MARAETEGGIGGTVGGRGRGIRLPGLKDARTEAGYSMRRLEAESGVSRSTIWHLELGERGAQSRTVERLAKTIGVPVRALTRAPGRADGDAPAEVAPNFGVAAAAEKDFEFAALRAEAEGISEDEALGRMMRERKLAEDRRRRWGPRHRPLSELPRITRGLTASEAVAADRA